MWVIADSLAPAHQTYEAHFILISAFFFLQPRKAATMAPPTQLLPLTAFTLLLPPMKPNKRNSVYNQPPFPSNLTTTSEAHRHAVAPSSANLFRHPVRQRLGPRSAADHHRLLGSNRIASSSIVPRWVLIHNSQMTIASVVYSLIPILPVITQLLVYMITERHWMSTLTGLKGFNW